MKVLLTKYACSSGVTVIEGEDHGGTTRMFCQAVPSGCFSQNFHRDDWHKTKESAMAKVDSMFDKRQKSLEKALAGLQKKRQKALSTILAADLT